MTETCPNCGEDLTSENVAGGLCGRCLFSRGIEFASTANFADLSTPGLHPFTAPDPVEIEAELLNYDVLELIGQGGMGAVYKARQRNLDRTVAIKILPRNAAGGHEFADRFQREVRALARLRHPNIVMAYDFGLTDRYSYCVMEYVSGPNLREYLRDQGVAASEPSPSGLAVARRGQGVGAEFSERSCSASEQRERTAVELQLLSPRHSLEIARDICTALQYAHENGVIHRDIKPENVLLDEAGRVKIADFGLAKLLNPDPRDLALTQTRHFMGTLNYMAPEQCERPHQTDHRADIYSLGVLLYELLTGELPLGRFDPPSSRAAIDPLIDDVVLRALEKDPARRYQSAAGFGEAIQIVLDTPDDDSSPLRGDAGRGAILKEGAIRRFTGRKPVVAAALFGFLALIFFGWQILLKYQRDKDGNSTFKFEASGGEDTKKQTTMPHRSSGVSGTRNPRFVLPHSGDEIRLDKSLDDAPTKRSQSSNAEEIVSRVLRNAREADYQQRPSTLLRPLAAIRWENERAYVEIDRNWYELLGIEGYSTVTILEQARKAYPKDYQVKVENDLRTLLELVQNKSLDRLVLWLQFETVKGAFVKADITRHGDRLRIVYSALDPAPGGGYQPAMSEQRPLDAPRGEPYMKTFLLQHADPKETFGLLQNFFTHTDAAFQVVGNEIHIRADSETMSKMEALISRLDRSPTSAKVSRTDAKTNSTETASTKVTKIFRLNETLAQETKPLLERLFPDSDVHLGSDNISNSIIASGDSETIRQIEDLLLRLDRPPRRRGDGQKQATGRPADPQKTGPTNEFQVFALKNVRARDAQQMLQQNLPDFTGRFAVDDRANSLVVSADSETLNKVELFIRRLDEQDAAKTIKPGQALRISATGTLVDAPIEGSYVVDREGFVNLGAEYGKVKVAGMSSSNEVETAVLSELRKVLKSPQVTVSIYLDHRIEPKDAAAQPNRVRKIIALEEANAEAAVKTLKGLFPNSMASVDIVQQSNSVLVEADTETMFKIQAILSSVDYSEGARGPETEFREHVPQTHDASLIVLLRNHQRLAEINAELKKHRAVANTDSSVVSKLETEVHHVMSDIQNKEDFLRNWTLPPEFNIKTVVHEDQELKVFPDGTVLEARPLTAEALTKFEIELAKRIIHEYGPNVLRLPHRKVEAREDQKKEPRAEALPIHITHAVNVQNELGKLAVHYTIYDGDDLPADAKYFLAVNADHLGRNRFALGNWPYHIDRAKLDDVPGIIFAPRNFRLTSGEGLEIFIEMEKTPESKPLRVSNVLKHTWNRRDTSGDRHTGSLQDQANGKKASSGQEPTKIVIEDGSMLKVAPDGKILESRQLNADELRLSPQDLAARDGHQLAGEVRDDEVSIIRHVHIAPGATSKKEPRTEELPVHIAHAESVQKENGRLTVDYEMYGDLPRTVVVRRGNADAQFVVPYLLVIKGPHLGRKEFILSNWPSEKQTDDYAGRIIAPRKLRINNGEPLEIFIERGLVPGAERLRVSNIVKLTWKIPGAPTEDIRHVKNLNPPFSAIHWKDERPQVEINDRWYDVLAVGDEDIKTIVERAQLVKPKDYQQAVEADLAAKLAKLGTESQDRLQLKLRRLDNGEPETIEVRRSGGSIEVLERAADPALQPESQDEAKGSERRVSQGHKNR